jgi:hypothetical protein
MTGIDMIYNALDNLSKPVENDWTEKIERLERKVDGFIAKIKLYEEALEVACDEVEKILDGADYSCSLCFIDEDSMPIGDCDNDCGVCLKTYFLKRGQENIDREKACKDEVEGRKRMNQTDVAQEILERRKNG